jgi:hypothetical protein
MDVGGVPGIAPPAARVGNVRAQQMVWYCSRCNAVVGTGPNKPDNFNCPSCGARFSWGIAGGIGGAVALLIGLIVLVVRKAMA